MRIPYDELFDGLLRVLLKLNLEQQRARLCARLRRRQPGWSLFARPEPLFAIRANDSKWSHCS